LLWEISGNGLKQPSYLFGSMHVSNKAVFHLSDSFYTAIASCDMVSLEVDPREWQPDMFRLDQAKSAATAYISASDNELMSENDFRLRNYQDALKAALREEPYVVNGLLYRTNASQVNFQENTYLDLYIYQTARKLGKKATGVENYLETERLSEESAMASLKEKRERRIFPEGESEMTILNKLQDAYRRGDLTLLDSLNEMLSVSKSFTEKFMYPRNEIQANAIDSIIRHQSLFVAVGAAHLPGRQGVIERLRKKGYTLRPVKISDQDGRSREEIDKKHVPIEWQPAITADGFIECRLPGPWFRREESLYNESWQYADMENGSYYMLTRVRTNAGITGENSEAVKMKIDSLLYDNIPGKIQQKKAIERNGYPGFDIINKTRAGDVQRYLILVTPGEILLFKMSGNEDYVSGEDANSFFNSIKLKEPVYQPTDYSPAVGGFRAVFPQSPRVYVMPRTTQDRFTSWQYEAMAPTGETYLLLKKNIDNTHFLVEDTLDLRLVEESLKGSPSLVKEISRHFGKQDGYDCLDMQFSRKDGGRLKARAVIRGSDYYLLIAASKDEKGNFSSFFDGFRLTQYQYGPSALYIDTTRYFSVRTPVSPRIEPDLKSLTGITERYSAFLEDKGIYNNSPYNQVANFKSDSTGESIQVQVSSMPLYFYRKDSTKFWEGQLHWSRLTEDLVLSKKEFFRQGDSICGYWYTLVDTNTNRKIEGLTEVKGNRLFKVTALTDQLQEESSFVKDFFATFTPITPAGESSVFSSKSALFFARYNSPDSLVKKMTRDAAAHIVPEGQDLPVLEDMIERLDPRSNTYIEDKGNLILALGRIPHGHSTDSVIGFLRTMYERSDDTIAFQNAAIRSMVRMKKAKAYSLIKTWLILTPPVFENGSEIQDLFRTIGEDSTLAASLFPDILHLTSVEDYKRPVIDLLVSLADSDRISKEDYSDYFPNLLLDARFMLKKQQITDTRRNSDEDDEEEIMPGRASVNFGLGGAFFQEGTSPRPGTGNNRLLGYARLLMPFYDRPSVSRFFDQLLQTKLLKLRLSTAILLVHNGRPVPDSIWQSLAADDEYRSPLFARLEKEGRLGLFPAAYKTQEAMARASLTYSARYEKPTVIEPAGKEFVSTRTGKGYVYFFRYKLKDETPWLIAIGGLQPEKKGEVSAGHDLVAMTNTKLSEDSPSQQQFDKKLQQLLFSKQKSAVRFFLPAGRY
ncbi:MAG TPA: TraB/GumN family protein, partial [Puia sp.]|nr:TraB/GumN family protein [Puia sp.]